MSTVLVVDDCSTDRTRAGGLLKKAGCEVRYAANGRLALEAIAESPPDAVLTDLQMPEMDGLELVTTIAREFPAVPVVLMTSIGSEAIAVQALQAGAASYVPKKELVGQLAELILRLCAAAAEDRDLARLGESIVRQETVWQLDADLSLLQPTVRTVRDLLARGRRLDETALMRVGIAFEEALLNAVYHGNLEVSSDLREHDPDEYYDLARQRCGQRPYAGRTVRVELLLEPEQARFRITDEGPGFDPASLPDPTDPENIARASGRGLLLIRTFMDEVAHSDRGNQITMVKRFPPRKPTPNKPAALAAAS